jgi:hypothetical protein
MCSYSSRTDPKLLRLHCPWALEGQHLGSNPRNGASHLRRYSGNGFQIRRSKDLSMTDRPSKEIQQRRLAPLKHGAYSESTDALRLRARRVRYLCRRVKKVMPWLSPADEPTLRAWAELEIIGSAIFMDLAVKGWATDNGQPRRLLTEYRLLRQTQLLYERELGMTPQARMQLQVGDSRSRALDVSAELERGRQARLAAQARQSRSKASDEDTDADEGDSA